MQLMQLTLHWMSWMIDSASKFTSLNQNHRIPVPQSLPPESSPKENKFYLQLSLNPMSVLGTTVMQMPLNPMSVPGITVRWLLHHGRRENLLGAITAFLLSPLLT